MLLWQCRAGWLVMLRDRACPRPTWTPKAKGSRGETTEVRQNTGSERQRGGRQVRHSELKRLLG